MQSVPRIPKMGGLNETIHEVLVQGTYKGKIVEVQEPKQMVSKPMFRIAIVLEVEGRKGFCYYCGYLPAMHLIWCMKSFLIGQEVEVRVRVREFQGHYHNSFDIIWKDQSNGTPTSNDRTPWPDGT